MTAVCIGMHYFKCGGADSISTAALLFPFGQVSVKTIKSTLFFINNEFVD